ncbi:Modf protein [Candida orthopsilosis Co 90-125]|uniref:Modf protein n=1 Tax=Candida orthopsilosis (strain 90-125) TaxID=1136231 RepID=H8X9R0_CANO9|nr:Modf protein [Candida orthopsilosis Co 90-125]CCG24726.1 Modf protein [Candida orthopsilosis Co 90-125]
MSNAFKGCLLSIKNAKFKKNSLKNAPFVFANPIPDFQVMWGVQDNDTSKTSAHNWAVTGPSKSTMLKIAAGDYISFPPLSRSYPLINEPATQLQFLNFNDKSGLDRVHMSARYESYSFKGVLEMSDDTNSVFNYITGLNNYNTQHKNFNSQYINHLMSLFNLSHLQKKWINSLSNGQMRRARIAKSLVNKPRLLIIDDPFLGLDPSNTEKVSQALRNAHETLGTSIVLGLRLQDDIPSWIENISFANEEGIALAGRQSDPEISNKLKKIISANVDIGLDEKKLTEKILVRINPDTITEAEPIHIEFNNARVAYKDLIILKDFNWMIPKGSKWRIMGDNGTGKTTILSLITADHPQSWRSILKINDKLRKTGSGVTFFDVNNQIGISSPELHALVPQHNSTMKDIIYNGLVRDIGNSNFAYKAKLEKLDKDTRDRALYILNKFGDILEQHGNMPFIDLSMTNQKLALFLRAVIKNPEILILDEAFSCMEDAQVMRRCHDFIAQDPLFKNMTILSIGHIDWELNKYDYMLKLTGDENRSYEVYKVETK